MSSSTRQRYVAIVIAGALHVLILVAVIRAPRSQPAPAEDTLWSTLFFVPAAVVPRPSPVKPEPKHAFAPTPARVQAPEAEVAQSIATAPNSSSGTASIDWMAALQGAAAELASQGGSGDSAHGTPRPSSAFGNTHSHAYGEQYKLETGETVVWVSDHCFVVSEPQLLGTPNAFAHAALTHTQCVRAAKPRADMFKDLPEYKKHNEAP